MRRWMIAGFIAAAAGCSPAAPVEGANEKEEAAGLSPIAMGELASIAPAGTYKLDKLHTFLTWTIPHNTLSNYLGRFTRYEATIVWDPENPEKSSIEMSIDPLSVVTNYPGDYQRTHAVRGFASWDAEIGESSGLLNGKAFPQITFKSTSIETTGERTAKVTGDLNFRGVIKPVTLDVTLNGAIASHPFRRIPAMGFAARGQFKPTDFGVQLISSLRDPVTIAFDGEFQRQPDTPAPAG